MHDTIEPTIIDNEKKVDKKKVFLIFCFFSKSDFQQQSKTFSNFSPKRLDRSQIENFLRSSSAKSGCVFFFFEM